MILVNIAKFLAAAAAILLAHAVVFIGFMIAVFGRLDLFYWGIGLLNLLACGLALRAALVRRENHLWTALEFFLYGLITISARFMVTDLALVASGALVLAGLLALVGALTTPKTTHPNPYWR